MSAPLPNQLINAIWRRDITAVKALLDSGAELNAVGSSGATPLTQAAEMGNLEIARLLLEKGADVNHRNRQGHTPLHIAVDATIDGHIQEGGKQWDEETQMIELLLEHGASTAVPDHHNKTPLDWAINYRSQKVMSLLKSWQDTKSYEGAARNTMTPAIEFVQKRAKREWDSSRSRTPLAWFFRLIGAMKVVEAVWIFEYADGDLNTGVCEGEPKHISRYDANGLATVEKLPELDKSAIASTTPVIHFYFDEATRRMIYEEWHGLRSASTFIMALKDGKWTAEKLVSKS
jgi:Ankyrin repeats (many copies)